MDPQTRVLEFGHQIRCALEGRPCRAPVDVPFGPLRSRGDGVDRVGADRRPDGLWFFSDHPARQPRRARRVLEVILPTSTSHEHVLKLAAYERAGLSAYWLAHPVDRIRGIYRLEGECYVRLRVVGLMEETPLGALPAVVVCWGPS